MRPISNLHEISDFNLPIKDRRSGFFTAYSGRLGVPINDFFHKILIGLFIPEASSYSVSASAKKLVVNDTCYDDTRKRSVQSTLRRDKDTLIYETPLVSLLESNNNTEISIISLDKLGELTTEHRKRTGLALPLETVKISDTIFRDYNVFIPFEKLAVAVSLPTLCVDKLKSTLLGVELKLTNGKPCIWFKFVISKVEAEYLNSVSFYEINLGNFYSVLVEWSASVLGRNYVLPERISPISKIAASVTAVLEKTPVKPRTGLSDLVIDMNNNIMYFPTVNKSAQYEQMLIDFGLNEAGIYTWGGLNEDKSEVKIDETISIKRKLPTNLPIFTDWLNDKFAYSNTTGHINIYNLGNSVPLNEFHIRTFLEQDFDPVEKLSGASTDLMNAYNAVAAVNKISDIRPLISDFDSVSMSPKQREDLGKLLARNFKLDSLAECFNAANLLQTNFGNVSDLFISKEQKTTVVRVNQLDPVLGLPAFRFIGRILVECAEAAEKNVDALYRKYSVINVLHWFAVLRTFKTYSSKYAETVATDNVNREQYLTQATDPSYVQEALPLLKKDLNFLPHQAKISNLTRKSPKIVVLPVDAGGGKTIVILTDILRELKKKTVKRPIIICPAHLVSQYIDEVIYVTEGRLNLIPITNSTLKAHGEEKLRNFIVKSPPNSVVITDMHFLASRDERVAYGNKTISVYRNVEFLRQFEFDCVSIDEVHFLKNVKSNRRGAASRLMIDIPMKRIASGTIIADTMLDLVSQIALLDPSLFGSEERFKREWALEVKGNKVISWKAGAEKDVRKIIQEHAVVASAKRKEWAVLLPPSEEIFLAVDLSDSQRLLYESILKETIDLIAEAALKNDELKSLLEKEDEDGSSLEAMLRPYLARLEKFLSAPNDDFAAGIFLKNLEDQISPKLKKAYERCELHLARQLPGKILLFTQYTSTAEAFFNYAPSSLKDKIIHYTADKKLECRFEFENNPEKSIMIGVSSSMDTGLNLQHVSRLIRLESVWTPGVLEQGNSRLNRPQLKKAEKRDTIFFDWILVNRTIDVTKIARLTSKIVSKAKFDEFDNQNYQDLEDLPKVSLTLESIAENNDFATELMPYLEGYQDFKKVQKEDYAQYVAENGDTLVPTPVPSSGLLEGSKLMSRIPYVPGMNVYGTDQLGLIRYDQFLRQDLDTIDDNVLDSDTDEDNEEEISEDDPKALVKKQLRDKRIKERILLKDKPVHTDFGDGVITGLGNKYVRVRLSNGTRIRLLKLQTFIITRATTNNKDLRNELLKQVGDLPLDAPIEVPVEQGAEDTKRKKKNSGVETAILSGEFQFTILNDFLSVQYVSDEISDSLLRVLQNLGFKTSPDYAFTKVSNARNLLLLFKAWKDKGFTISKGQSTLFKSIFDAIKGNRAALRNFGLATQLDFTLFYRDQIKPSTDPNSIKVYPLIQDGILYLIAPTKGQTGNLKALRTMSQGIKWKKAGGNTELLKFVKTKGEAKQVVKNILDAGVTITNLKAMGETFKSIKLS